MVRGSIPRRGAKNPNMKIHYEDEYGVALFSSGEDGYFPPSIGDTVIIRDEEWRVKSRAFYPDKGFIVVQVSQNQVKIAEADAPDDRLNEVKNAVAKLDKKVTTQEKKQRMLSEELVSVRTYLKAKK